MAFSSFVTKKLIDNAKADNSDVDDDDGTNEDSNSHRLALIMCQVLCSVLVGCSLIKSSISQS